MICLNFVLAVSLLNFAVVRNHGERVPLHQKSETVSDLPDNTDAAEDDPSPNDKKSPSNCRRRTLMRFDQDLFPNSTMDFVINDTAYRISDKTVTVCAPDHHKICDVNAGCGLPSVVYFAILLGYASFFFVVALFWITVNLRYLFASAFVSITLVSNCLIIILKTLDFDKISENQDFWVSMPILVNYYFFATYSWMGILTSEAFMACPRIVRNIKDIDGCTVMTDFKDFFVNALLLSLFFGLLSIFVSLAIPLPVVPDYEEFCWIDLKKSSICFFCGPFFVLVCFNLASILACGWVNGHESPELKIVHSVFDIIPVPFIGLSAFMFVLWSVTATSTYRSLNYWPGFVYINIIHWVLAHIVTILSTYCAVENSFRFIKREPDT